MSRTRANVANKVSIGLAAALLLAGCSGDGDASGDGEPSEPIKFGIISGWYDGIIVANIWQEILVEEGYEVEFVEIADAGPLYSAAASGAVDIISSQLPTTHGVYLEEYGDDLEDLGVYHDNALLTLAVPEYTDINSIAELNDHADELGGRIIGIEAGSGLNTTTRNSVFPAYGLEENFELVESSTAAMLAELGNAIDNEEDIVVTLWRPYWANTAYPVKDLEDPELAFGETETLHLTANHEFSSRFPEVADRMGEFWLSDEQYGEIENMIVNEYDDGEAAQAVRDWLDANPEFRSALTE